MKKISEIAEKNRETLRKLEENARNSQSLPEKLSKIKQDNESFRFFLRFS